MKRLFFSIIALFICASMIAQVQVDEVTLMVSSDGSTKDEAIKTALRSAIEQAYGTFVSASTEILNDELVRDEIITVTQGNIKNYQEIASYQQEDGRFYVTLQATVSISKLISYAQTKGAKTEFAGAVFAMNLKLKQLNKENEEIAIKNVLNEMTNLLKKGFNHKVSHVKVKADGTLTAMITTSLTPEGLMAWELYEKTLNNLTLSKDEINEYEDLGLKIYYINLRYLDGDKYADDYNRSGWISERKYLTNDINYYLRSELSIKLFGDFLVQTFVPFFLNMDIVTNVKTIHIHVDEIYDTSKRDWIMYNLNGKKAKRIFARDNYLYSCAEERLDYMRDGYNLIVTYTNMWHPAIDISKNSICFSCIPDNWTLYHGLCLQIPIEDLSKISSFEIRQRID